MALSDPWQLQVEPIMCVCVVKRRIWGHLGSHKPRELENSIWVPGARRFGPDKSIASSPSTRRKPSESGKRLESIDASAAPSPVSNAFEPVLSMIEGCRLWLRIFPKWRGGAPDRKLSASLL